MDVAGSESGPGTSDTRAGQHRTTGVVDAQSRVTCVIVEAAQFGFDAGDRLGGCSGGPREGPGALGMGIEVHPDRGDGDTGGVRSGSLPPVQRG